MAVYNNGSFLMYSNGGLYKFDSEGIFMWKMDGYQFREHEAFPVTPLNMAIDSERGFIYMADYAASRVLKFFDSSHETAAGNENSNKIISLNRKINSDPDSVDLIWEKVNYYYEQKAWVLAKMWLEEIINVNPFDNKAESLLVEMELKSLMEQVGQLRADTFEIIEKLGPESARQQYSLTVQLFEKILSLNPGNQQVIHDLNKFKESFNQEAATPGTQLKPLTIASIEIDNIFPSLIHYYKNTPVGKVVIKNDLDKTIFNIKAELNLRQFIDFPKDSEIITSLAPGEESVLFLNIQLNEKAFNIQEDLPVLAQINVSYEIDGSRQSVSQTTGATLYRRTALSWDNTAKLAAFIMPNEGIVSAFSHRVLDIDLENRGLPSKLVKAARICDALGTYGITYVEDPDSPFSQIQGKEQFVDTVRYPRTTLYIRSGDCDDTTALLTSLLESSGIGTAIMTSPGHVFLAFDTEEPLSNKWMFETENLRVVEFENTLWIPLESTLLSRGFYYSWTSASSIINQNSPENIEFVPVKNQRETFPPLPLAESNLIVVEPESDQIAPLYNQSIQNLMTSIYDLNVTSLESEINGINNRKNRQLNIKLGILHARFLNYNKAISIFNDLIKADSNYISPYMNLGNLYYYRKDYDKAISIFEQAREIKPDSVMLNLSLAKTYHKLHDRQNTVRFFNIVQSQSESLSEKFAYLVNNIDAVRAGINDEPPLNWESEE
jgi:tetratricopeptide (TPR) repeat protein